MYSGPLYISSDHGGYQLKKRLVRYIQNELVRNVEDLGPHEYDKADDYPDYAIPLAKKTVETNGRGITICSSGIGVCMAANKVAGARAGLGYNIEVAESMIRDDNTNILCLGASMISEDHALAIVKRWLETQFEPVERYVRRINKVHDLES
ncbi:MAG: ribose-5-phosphate isomerase [Candidatus Magasanikbacteria bacterium CG10_big_fil_rev_8_21_14_0_10_43_6]|uniref:Ribose-5-phosphate isomerase n=1 Tax=Candidatus Magasanikbacteria bacterium CG10_big_fil_rev_8_21_14_0_10_43_6 TaxID=1974650 RepID=A0A2M6W253_9BACT|nr:MAG: ribose-5-phosphate isomerase [Candidatus Magasanikbacteria bacterium CG10_big_fil_rev_8_21_14_0_10_43_6]